MNRTLSLFAAAALTFAVTAPAAFAQSTDDKAPDSLRTYYLNTSQQNDAEEILVAVRSVISGIKADFVSSQNAIVVSGPPEGQAKVQKVIADLDRPRKAYRLTFTLADSDNGKRIGVQHFSIVVAAGQRTTLKQGSKIPVITGSYDAKGGTQQTQFTFLDIGMSFDVSLDDSPGGLRLKSHVEESSVGSPSEYGSTSGPLAQEPIVHQTTLEGTSIITIGKPLTLGSVDIAGSTRHIDIEVVAEPVS